MHKLVRKAERLIKKNRMFCRGHQIGVALSGGPDSMALLHTLNTCFREKMALKLTAIHINHNLRGNESDQDEAFVKQICKMWKIRLIVKNIDIPGSIPRGESIENFSRMRRYQCFSELMESKSLNVICTAHTKTDQAETILMRIMQGTGLLGLRGILPKREDGIIRPLLEVTKPEVLKYVKEHDVPYRSDSSNKDCRFLRNKIRLRIMPALISDNPEIEDDLVGISAISSRLWESRRESVEKELVERFRSEKDGTIFLNLERPLKYSELAARRLTGMLDVRPTERTLKSIVGLIKNNAGKSIKLAGNKKVWRIGGGLAVYGKEKAGIRNIGPCRLGKTLVLKPLTIKAKSRMLKVTPKTFPAAADRDAYLDADKVGLKWHFRGWRKGDRFKPLGMRGKKKVSDLLSEKRLPRPHRESVIVMESRGRIAWVVGFRISEEFKIDKETKRAIHIYLVD